jgi:hypothetical protein
MGLAITSPHFAFEIVQLVAGPASHSDDLVADEWVCVCNSENRGGSAAHLLDLVSLLHRYLYTLLILRTKVQEFLLHIYLSSSYQRGDSSICIHAAEGSCQHRTKAFSVAHW